MAVVWNRVNRSPPAARRSAVGVFTGPPKTLEAPNLTLELLFPRDISELRVYTRRAQSSAAADAGLLPRDENL